MHRQTTFSHQVQAITHRYKHAKYVAITKQATGLQTIHHRATMVKATHSMQLPMLPNIYATFQFHVVENRQATTQSEITNWATPSST
jgi:hypothetical protein